MSQPPKTYRPHGTWASPITPLSLARRFGLSDVAWDESGALVWLETRSDRGVLVVQPPDGQAQRDLNSNFSVRAGVGYGGGDFTTGGGLVYFVEAASGRIFSQSLDGGPARALTPAFGSAAAPKLSPDGRWLLYIHSYEGQDCLAIVDAAGAHWPRRLVGGSDFYMQPAWHPDSTQIAWIAWNHPNMPWDGTGLYTGRLAFSETGLPWLESSQAVAGGDTTAIFQPEFSPDGRWLAYVADTSGWWHLYRVDLISGEQRQLTTGEAEYGLPAWVQGMRVYCFSPDGHSLYAIRNQQSFASLWRLDVVTGADERLLLPEEYTWLEQPAVSPDGNQIALAASGSGTPARLVLYKPGGGTRILRRTSSEDIPAAAYSLPHSIQWPGQDGGTVHGLYYPPHSQDFEAGPAAPLILLVHSGPTSQSTAGFSPDVQFFTSRGFAVLEANFRGSAGYGRVYRDMLRGNWGIFDVADNLSGANYLVTQGLADPTRLAIMGGSSGGFTVLQALIEQPGFFRAGISLYGVSNQFGLVQDTHKFEAHYSEGLLGRLPEAAGVYRARSPLFAAERIRDALAIFQGEADKVVPRSQSDELVASLRRRGVPHIYHLYPGEGHGFRKSETIEHLYREIERFLLQYVIFI